MKKNIKIKLNSKLWNKNIVPSVGNAFIRSATLSKKKNKKTNFFKEEILMKKLLILILICGLAIGLSAKIHVFAGGNMDWANLSAKSGAASLDSESKFGFHAGGSYIMDMGQIMIEPGVKFQTRGYAYTIGDKTYDANYIDIFGKFGYTLSEAIPATVYLGIDFGILMTAEAAGRDVKDEMKALNISVPVGLRYVFMDKFTTSFEYDLGVTNLLDGEAAKYLDMTFQSFLFSVGYLF